MEENNFCMRKICQDLNSHAPTLHLVSFQRCGEKFLVWGTTLRTCTGTTLSKLSGGPLRNSLDIESEKSLKIEIKSDLLFQLTLLTQRFAKMRLERIEKLGVEMIEILPQVVQRNISKRHLQQYMLISWSHGVTSTFHSDTDKMINVFQIEDAKGQNLFQTIGISSLSDSESRWIWICFVDMHYAGLHGLLRALSCSK